MKKTINSKNTIILFLVYTSAVIFAYESALICSNCF